MSKLVTVVLGIVLVVGMATANNLKISNLEVKGRDNQTALIKFDIAWENSWRFADAGDPLYFHDAAWVFFKVKPDMVDGVLSDNHPWQHARLAGSGVNPLGFAVGEGTAVELAVPADGMGLFVRRATDGIGTTAVQKVTAVWDFTANGLVKTDKVKIQAAGLEMCYVATGAFWVGDGLKDNGQFFEGSTGDNPQPFAITSAGAIPCSNQVGCLWGASTSGDSTIGPAGMIPSEFPNGYDAFYCMKYEVTQGQYTDFLNTLTRVQQATRCVASTTVGNYMSATVGGSVTVQHRNTVRLLANPDDPYPRVYTNASPDRACNWLSWADLTAFAVWSGLRPMTELEFEKACRGPLEPVAGEYAWGNLSITPQTGHSGADGSGLEEPLPTNANCNYGSGIQGPVRAGIYARANSTRERSGASYWGIMELSGNLWERTVAVGSATGRNFTGVHGGGTLLDNGWASVVSWPDVTAIGTGGRGGNWISAAFYACASDRFAAAFVSAARNFNYGGRAVRSAP